MPAVLAVWCLTFAAYLLFAGTASVDELVTAVVLAGLAAAWAQFIRGCSPRRFAKSRELVAPLWRAIGSLFRATAQTGKLLLKVAAAGGSPGRLHVTNFHYGRRNDPVQRSRRAAAVLLASLAPDRFVVAVDRKSRTVLIHNLIRRDHEPDRRWLE
ncbi:MAG TPA: hypothetical protein VHY10_05705 [Xanthobacteraceae bacterium]|jgi:hypothetical protein|nr:hypothetical protein [Xanthobacteraceae bacterium]